MWTHTHIQTSSRVWLVCGQEVAGEAPSGLVPGKGGSLRWMHWVAPSYLGVAAHLPILNCSELYTVVTQRPPGVFKQCCLWDPAIFFSPGSLHTFSLFQSLWVYVFFCHSWQVCISGWIFWREIYLCAYLHPWETLLRGLGFEPLHDMPISAH